MLGGGPDVAVEQRRADRPVPGDEEEVLHLAGDGHRVDAADGVATGPYGGDGALPPVRRILLDPAGPGTLRRVADIGDDLDAAVGVDHAGLHRGRSHVDGEDPHRRALVVEAFSTTAATMTTPITIVES